MVLYVLVEKVSKTLCTEQARSQDLEKGGGLFWKSENCAKDLDPKFHCSWISFTRFVRKLRRNFSESSEIQRYFPPKIRWSPKKKKGLRLILRPKSEIQTFFPPKIRWPPTKKKKVLTEIETDFSAEIGNSNVFSAQNQVVSKKKKGLHRNWDWFFGRNRKPKRFRGGCFPMGGGYFQFFTKNRAQNQQKGAILHTSQANGRGSSPPWLRYWHWGFFN